MKKKVGVLALQGGVAEHIKSLSRLNDIDPLLIKKPEQLKTIDGLIIPGGESTTLSKLINIYGFTESIKKLHQVGKPIWGTCAGLILLAGEIEEQPEAYLKLINIKVRRNAYGSQLASFLTEKIIPAFSQEPLQLIFIRAPLITAWAPQVKLLASINQQPVAAEEKNVLVTSFHPELGSSLAVHQYFVDKIK